MTPLVRREKWPTGQGTHRPWTGVHSLAGRSEIRGLETGMWRGGGVQRNPGAREQVGRVPACEKPPTREEALHKPAEGWLAASHVNSFSALP